MAKRILVCFAVREEAAPFVRRSRNHPAVEILLTGMGAGNASRRLTARLQEEQPGFVLSCGFAGGLDPALRSGEVVFEADPEGAPANRLVQAGARPVRFHQANSVVVRAADKQRLHQETGAGAVEMESTIIRNLCAGHGIPSATVRVISDTASEDLPLDFNRLMTADHRIHFGRLGWQVVRSPRLIPELIRFQQRCSQAAYNLSRVLNTTLEGWAINQ